MEVGCGGLGLRAPRSQRLCACALERERPHGAATMSRLAFCLFDVGAARGEGSAGREEEVKISGKGTALMRFGELKKLSGLTCPRKQLSRGTARADASRFVWGWLV